MSDDLKARLRAHIERETRGRTHDGSDAGTANWWVRLRYDDVQAALAHITALEAEVGRLREGRAAIQYEAERENGGWVHLKRVIAVQARALAGERG